MSEGDGGIPARRAVVRWAWRLYRREWRQQILVPTLLTVAVATAIGFASAAYNTAGVGDLAEFGTANHRYQIDEPDPRTLVADVAAAQERFGTVDVISHWYRPVPGSVESVELRSQDPYGPFSEPMLALRDGRYPTSAGEIAVTDGVAQTFQLDIGSRFGLDGHERTVVGLAENPSNLNDEFALLAPTDDESPESVTILIGGTGSFDEVASLRRFGAEHLPEADITSRSDNANDDVVAAAAVLGVATVALVLVALTAAASFVAVAQRRLRQLGMLSAIGATEKHLRLVVLANGAVIGCVAAILGVALGLGGWVAVAPRIESAVAHRIDPLNVPWWLIATAMALVIAAASLAAWWPARAVARVPTTLALSGRPPTPRPVRGSAALAAVVVALGVVCLLVADGTNPALVIAGTAATVIGILLVSPAAIRALAATAGRSPIAVRLALRDLARYRARSAAALAAISLALGIPVALVVVGTAAAQAAHEGNLSNRQLLIWTRDTDQPEGVSPFYTQDPDDEGFSPYLPRLTPADVANLETQVDRIAAPLSEPTVTGLDVAIDPATPETPNGRLAVTLARTTSIGYLDIALLYVASPGLLDHYGLELEALDPDAAILTVEPGELWFANTGDRPTLVPNLDEITAGHSSIPGSFITPRVLQERAWESTRVGWLLEASRPLTIEQLTAARKLAADAGLLIEARDHEEGLVSLRWWATGAGILVALGILAMTVGLIRNAAARDLRTLTATGATSTTRRTLTGATAGGLALLGAALGTAGAYLSVGAGYADADALTPIPMLQLTTIIIGVPLAAALAGWLLAGREPPALTRQPIE